MKTSSSMAYLFSVLSALFAADISMADDERVYESLANVKIGVVFFSPAERERLDRGLQPRSRTTGVKTENAPRTNSADRSAGYIVRSDGVVSVYKQGDFVESSSVTAIRFPGEIKISSTRPVTKVDQSAKIQSTDSSSDAQ